MDSVVFLIAVPPKQQSSFTTSLLGISIVVNLLLCLVFFGFKWESWSTMAQIVCQGLTIHCGQLHQGLYSSSLRASSAIFLHRICEGVKISIPVLTSCSRRI